MNNVTFCYRICGVFCSNDTTLKVEEELVQLTGCFAQQGAIILKFSADVLELTKRIALQILCNSLFRMATLFQRNFSKVSLQPGWGSYSYLHIPQQPSIETTTTIFLACLWTHSIDNVV